MVIAMGPSRQMSRRRTAAVWFSIEEILIRDAVEDISGPIRPADNSQRLRQCGDPVVVPADEDILAGAFIIIQDVVRNLFEVAVRLLVVDGQVECRRERRDGLDRAVVLIRLR
jgi:hypothetical protein